MLFCAPPRRNQASGFYIVFFLILTAGLIALIALVLGIGVIASDSTRMQHLANIAALSALKQYVDDRAADPNTPLNTLAASLRVRANIVLNQNGAIGAGTTMGGLKFQDVIPDSGGRIRLGAWYTEQPNGGFDPCDPVQGYNPEPSEHDFTTGNPRLYPCFVPVTVDIVGGTQSPPNIGINAVRIDLQNEATNPIIAPFTSLFGQRESRVLVRGTAALVQRCTAYVLDTTMTSATETHSTPPRVLTPPRPDNMASASRWRNANPADPAQVGTDWVECDGVDIGSALPQAVLCPKDTAYFAYHMNSLTDSSQGSAPFAPVGAAAVNYFNTACAGPAYIGDTVSGAENKMVWCNMMYEHNVALNGATPLSGHNHYPQFYRQQYSPNGKVYMDLVMDPEPLRSFFLAFNAGLRLVRSQSTSGDQAVVIPFDGETRFRYPRGANQMTSNLDLLIQLTNMQNRGTISPADYNNPSPITGEIHPNFVDMGWFPVANGVQLRQRTHTVKAISDAIDTLEASCPTTAQKAIIIATDGIPNCAFGFSPECYPATRDYNRYVAAENQMLDTANPNSIINRLRNSRIALTTILRGEVSGPNYKNIFFNGRYLDPNEALKSGLYTPNQVVDYDSSVDPANPYCGGGCSAADRDQYAYLNAGAPGYVFRRVNLIYASLAKASGGLICPLLDICSNIPVCGCTSVNDCYLDQGSGNPRVLRPDCRTAGATNYCAPTTAPIGAQAAQCVANTVGGNPFVLVN